MGDPFTVLGVAEDADDAAIRARYLALVREYPPDRAPDQFRANRAAYEAVCDVRKRLEARLLRTSDAALDRLKRHCLQSPAGGTQRASRRTVASLISESILQSDALRHGLGQGKP
jgi:curved DNA-binding protein CbpA